MITLIIKFGNLFINIVAWILAIVIVISSVGLLCNGNFATGIAVLIGGSIIFFFVFWFVYIMMSINDSVLKIHKILSEAKPSKK